MFGPMRRSKSTLSGSAVTISEETRSSKVLSRGSFRRAAEGREIVLVLGMHRSGTSLLANVLHLLGVDMVDSPTRSSSKNATGFWEREELVAVHDEILAALGAPIGSPAHVVPFRPGWWRSVEIRPLKDRLRELLASQLRATRRPWGFKDPRTCRLLPLWGEILEELEVSPRFVWAVRHPAESSRSMTAKNPELRPIPVPQSEVMWLAYNYDILRYTGRHWPLVVPYDAWFRDSLGLAREIAADLDLVWQGSDQELESALASLINAQQRHHWSEADKLTCHLALSEEVYRSILVMRAEPQSSLGETLALSLQSLLGAVQPFAEQASDLKSTREELQRQQSALETSQSGLAAAQARIAALEEEAGRQAERERILIERSERLTQKLTAARSERDTVRAELAELRQQLDQRAQELLAVAAERDRLAGEHGSLLLMNDRQVAEFAELGRKLDQFRKQALQAEAARTECEARQAATEAERDRLLQELADAKRKLEGFWSKFATLSSAFDEAQASRALMAGEIDSQRATLAQAQSELDALRAGLAAAEAAAAQLRDDVAGLETSLQAEVSRREDADLRLAALLEERKRLAEANAALCDERRALEARLAEQSAQLVEAEELRRRLEAMTADLAALRNTLRSERERFAEVRLQLQRATSGAGHPEGD